MKNISKTIPFNASKVQIAEAQDVLIREVQRNFLGRTPGKEEVSRFTQRINAGNSNINDHYFDGKKIGSLAVTYILDQPRSIQLDFTNY